jgi:hypothetical protein
MNKMNASLFDKIDEISVKNFRDYLSDLRLTCEADPAVSEFVDYILEYGVQQSLNQYSTASQIGEELCKFILQITGRDLIGGDLSNLGNRYEFNRYDFNLSWISDLNDFVSDYFYEDKGFNFEQGAAGVFGFFASKDGVERIAQNPHVLIEAAIANTEFYDNESDSARVMGHHVYAVANQSGY